MSDLLALYCWRPKQVLRRKERQYVANWWFKKRSSLLEEIDGRKKPNRKWKKESLNICCAGRTHFAMPLYRD